MVLAAWPDATPQLLFNPPLSSPPLSSPPQIYSYVHSKHTHTHTHTHTSTHCTHHAACVSCGLQEQNFSCYHQSPTSIFLVLFECASLITNAPYIVHFSRTSALSRTHLRCVLRHITKTHHPAYYYLTHAAQKHSCEPLLTTPPGISQSCQPAC